MVLATTVATFARRLRVPAHSLLVIAVICTVSQTVVAPIGCPRRTSSPWIR
ncbi:hypothetical protein OH807_06175 [Kitasatospora sp. NBC_01560]|uniref:hypothetical protein n=1 Tax=Kitasatospora sp. NBC_01560 TaxID=2975965 RepID=UPI00386E27F8